MEEIDIEICQKKTKKIETSEKLKIGKKRWIAIFICLKIKIVERLWILMELRLTQIQ